MIFNLPTFDLLSPQMKNLVNFPLNQNLLVVGAPGTGKSVVAVHRYKDLIKQKKKVLFLCFNRLLKDLLSTEVWSCKTINSRYLFQREQYFSQVLKKNHGDSFQTHGFGKYIDDDSVEKIEEIMQWYVSVYGKFDAIIIDEGQDLKPEILQGLGLITQHISIFADPNQPLKEECSDIGEIEHIFQGIHRETLDRNYRNTKEIYGFAAQKFMTGNELANNPNLTARSLSDPSSMPEIKQGISSIDDQQKIICEYIALHPNQTIGIFVHTQDQVDILFQGLQGLGIGLSMYHYSHRDKRDFDLKIKKNVLLTTYTSAKGLEFDVVILIIGTDMGEKTNQKLYVLSTRAKKKLYFIFS